MDNFVFSYNHRNVKASTCKQEDEQGQGPDSNPQPQKCEANVLLPLSHRGAQAMTVANEGCAMMWLSGIDISSALFSQGHWSSGTIYQEFPMWHYSEHVPATRRRESPSSTGGATRGAARGTGNPCNMLGQPWCWFFREFFPYFTPFLFREHIMNVYQPFLRNVEGFQIMFWVSRRIKQSATQNAAGGPSQDAQPWSIYFHSVSTGWKCWILNSPSISVLRDIFQAERGDFMRLCDCERCCLKSNNILIFS